MLVAVFTTFAASRKEPLGDMVERVHAAFIAAGFGEPRVHFTLSDPAGSLEANVVQETAGIKRVSSIGRVLKRWPKLQPFARVVGSSTIRGGKSLAMSNLTDAGAVESIDFAILQEIARGVPKSFPFQAITLHFSAPGFSEGPNLPGAADPRTLSQLMRAGVDIGAGHPTSPGVGLKDSWWVNGRQRFLSALRIVEADPSLKRLPAPSANVATVFAACGNVRKTKQMPLALGEPMQGRGDDTPRGIVATPAGEAMLAAVRAYRAKMPELLAKLPHDLPLQLEEPPSAVSGLPTSGPKKPDLVRAFAPLGYDCRGESGAFTLRRRTAGNLAVELTLDVGAWGNKIAAFMRVTGLANGQGFKAMLPLPVSRNAAQGQFPIGGPERWRLIVDNLATLVATLDHSFVPEIEAISGPSPEWFQPDSSPS